jgi:phage N-6-adenine-methyltransferase
MNSITKPRRNSALRKNTDVPTLAQMILDGQRSSKKLRRASQGALQEWFAQSERLNIARRHYGLRGERFIDFARRIGVDKSSAYLLVKLQQHRAAITSRCLDEAELAAKRGEPFQYPGWLTALGWFERSSGSHELPFRRSGDDDSDNRGTPQYIFDWISEQFGPFDLDVAANELNAKVPHYFTKAQNGLAQKWHGNVWMNPPYSDVEPWAKKAYEYARSGKGVVVALLPVWTETKWFDEYASHGRIILLRGRIRFVHGEKGSAPFPNMVVIWDGESTRRNDTITITIRRRPSDPQKRNRP